MLAIRMQRTGRSGHATFRVVVQDSAKSPTSGKVIAQLGNYDPHTKAASLDKEKAVFFLEHGAHPSDRVAMLLKREGVKLPGWVIDPTKKSAAIRHADKLRRNRPAEPEVPAEEPVAEVVQEVAAVAPPVEEIAAPVAEIESPTAEDATVEPETPTAKPEAEKADEPAA
jgi:small subunit ribosomal protein S16